MAASVCRLGGERGSVGWGWAGMRSLPLCTVASREGVPDQARCWMVCWIFSLRMVLEN